MQVFSKKATDSAYAAVYLDSGNVSHNTHLKVGLS